MTRQSQTVAVVTQPSGVTQALLTSKSRLSKRGLSIARLELVACQMGANLAVNTNNALKRWPIIRNISWSDSQVALCWIEQPFKNWKSFVSNRVRKMQRIKENLKLEWMNHADNGSRGATHNQLDRTNWWVGPSWLEREEH